MEFISAWLLGVCMFTGHGWKPAVVSRYSCDAGCEPGEPVCPPAQPPRSMAITIKNSVALDRALLRCDIVLSSHPGFSLVSRPAWSSVRLESADGPIIPP